MKLYKMIEIYLKHDNMHRSRTINTFICSNNHVNSCINRMLSLMCDASDFAVGAVLGQRIDKKRVAIYYASKTLVDAQVHYSTIEKELLAIIFALENFKSYFLGGKVIVYSDHATLKFLLKKKLSLG